MAHRWYVVHVYSGFENKVAQSIEEQAAFKGLSAAFEQVLVPTEEVVEMRRGSALESTCLSGTNPRALRAKPTETKPCLKPRLWQ